MSKSTTLKKFKWDIAISLCKQDVGFAKKLVKAINPNLKIFFYEDRQEELISKSGPIEFAQTFKEDSRVVVILSRDEWSKSFYTEIERNAIIDRTAVKNEGYQFLMIIPMMQGEIPPWYPSTQIYASPSRFSIEEIAHFIEFKVTEEGGIIKTLTVEDRYQNLIDRIEAKKAIINLQYGANAVQCAIDEIDVFKACFNKKIEFLRTRIIDRVYSNEFSPIFNRAHFGIGNYILECQFSVDYQYYYQIATAQDVFVTFELSQIFGSHLNKKSLEVEQRLFYYTPQSQAWAIPYLYEQESNSELQVLFHNRDNSRFYDLIKPMSTDPLIDYWFQQLLSKSTQSIERYI